MKIRVRDLARVLLALAAEGALLIGLWKASRVLGSNRLVASTRGVDLGDDEHTPT